MSAESMSLATSDWVAGVIFLFQSLLGILGNIFLLSQYVFLDFTGYKLKPTDVIVKNLIVANLLVLCVGGIRDALQSFEWHHVSDLICRLFPYLRRVGRGVSISTNCLLSIFQAVTIRPGWADLKAKVPKCVVPSLVLCWSVNFLTNVTVPLFGASTQNKKNASSKKSVRYCITTSSFFASLFFLTDAVCLVLMLWASSSMVFVLYRHKQRVQHLHRNSLSSRSSHESRATQTILLLASTFLFFFTLSSVFHDALILLKHLKWFLLNTASVLSLCFPSISPFMLLHREIIVSRFCSFCVKNIKSPTPVREM